MIAAALQGKLLSGLPASAFMFGNEQVPPLARSEVNSKPYIWILWIALSCPPSLVDGSIAGDELLFWQANLQGISLGRVVTPYHSVSLGLLVWQYHPFFKQFKIFFKMSRTYISNIVQ